MYIEPLLAEKNEICIEDSFVTLCSGWKQQTFKSNLKQMMKMGTAFLPLVYSSPDQMFALSNKREELTKIFHHLNHRKLGRIDATELYSTCLISCDGKFEDMLQNMILIYGFTDSENNLQITQEEFHLFLESLFRGIMNFVVPPQ